MKIRAHGEAETQKAILAILGLRGIPAWRINQGGVPLHGRPGFRPSPTRGVSDIIGILPGGRFLAIEVKRVGGKVTAEQLFFLDAVLRAGGLAIIAHSVDEVLAALEAA